MVTIGTIRAGLLVSLKTGISGNVTYRTTDIDPDHIDGDGARRAKWETLRTIEDPTEHEEAVKVRSKARGLITAICAPSSFGLLCPDYREEALQEATREALEIIGRFNARSTRTRVSLNIIAGKVGADDARAVRAINSEVRDLMEAMESGLRRLDVGAVREAANKARQLGAMLTVDAEAKTKAAIEAARSAARRIVKAGEGVAVEVDVQTLRLLQTARTAFLDLDESGEEAKAPEITGRAIEMDEAPFGIAVAADGSAGPIGVTFAPAPQASFLEF